MLVFWVGTPCKLTGMLSPEDGGTKFLRNIGIHPLVHIALQPRTSTVVSSRPWDPQAPRVTQISPFRHQSYWVSQLTPLLYHVQQCHLQDAVHVQNRPPCAPWQRKWGENFKETNKEVKNLKVTAVTVITFCDCLYRGLVACRNLKCPLHSVCFLKGRVWHPCGHALWGLTGWRSVLSSFDESNYRGVRHDRSSSLLRRFAVRILCCFSEPSCDLANFLLRGARCHVAILPCRKSWRPASELLWLLSVKYTKRKALSSKRLKKIGRWATGSGVGYRQGGGIKLGARASRNAVPHKRHYTLFVYTSGAGSWLLQKSHTRF
jgi:hypothetical protein